MPHLDIIRDENTHRAIAQRVDEGGEAVFAFMEANDDHFSHRTVFEYHCDTCAVFNSLSQPSKQRRRNYSRTNTAAT